MAALPIASRLSTAAVAGLVQLGAGLAVLICATVDAGAEAPAVDAAETAAGEKHFEQLCASCHNGSFPEAPGVEALKLYAPERIVEALDSGIMSVQGLPLSIPEMRQVAQYLTGKSVDAPTTQTVQFTCESASSDEPAAASRIAGNGWRGWGGAPGNQRFQNHEKRLNTSSVGELDLDWAFAFPQTTRVRSQPTVIDGVIYIGSQSGAVYAIDADIGCVHWVFEADTEVRGAIAAYDRGEGRSRGLVFGDFKANAYALDASSGELLWKSRVHEHPLATVTGSVAIADGLVYVPVSSSEVVPASTPSYPCCSFRGALTALRLEDGAMVWRHFTTDAPQATGKNSVGTQNFGPSGAPVWSSPTVDRKRGLVMLTTGQNYSSPATGTSDAVIALDAKSGERRWVSQVTAGDAWNGACVRKTANCPEEDGPDFDIGASAVLVTLSTGKDLILVGQKSGLVYAMDPDRDGQVLWRKRVGRGGTMGGVHWGMSSDGERLYVGISDLPTSNPYASGDPHPGLHALAPATGEFLWRTPVPDLCPQGLGFMCFRGISAAVSSSPGLVFAGGLDGQLRAYDAASGDILWTYDTRRSYDGVNGVAGFGGAIEADGPVVSDGRIYVTSGYDKWAELPGNVLLAFSLDKD